MEHIRIMSGEYDLLQKTLQGYIKFKVPLVAYDGTHILPSGGGTDPGLFYFIPKISVFLNIGLDQAINVFFIAIAVISVLSAVISSFFLLKDFIARVYAICMILGLAVLSLKFGDVHFIPPVIVLLIVPPFLLIRERSYVYDAVFYIFAGFLLAAANFVRIHAGTAVLLFMAAHIIAKVRPAVKKNIAKLVLLIAVFLMSTAYFNAIVEHSNIWLATNTKDPGTIVKQHVVWHSIYCGLGFIPNGHGIEWKDANAIAKVMSVNSSVELYSQDYEQILKKEVIKTITHDPHFVLRTVFAKTGIMVFYFLILANISFLSIVKRNSVSLLAPFGIALCFSALPGLLVMPDPPYIQGYFAFTVMFSMMCFDKSRVACKAYSAEGARNV